MKADDIARRLRGCTFTPASFDKRFVRDANARLDAGEPLTDKQAALVLRFGHRYRRQLGACPVEGCGYCSGAIEGRA